MSMSMNRGNIATIIVLLAILTVVAYILFYDNINWNEHYRNDNKDPYSTMVLYELMKRDRGDKNFKDVPADSLSRALRQYSGNSGNTYMVIGNNVFYTEEDGRFLLDWAARGNTVFLSVNFMPDEITDTLTRWICTPIKLLNNYGFTTGALSHDSVYISFNHPEFAGKAEYLFRMFNRNGGSYTWQVFRDQCSKRKLKDDMVIAGTLDGDPNFMIYRWGKGSLILHSTPAAFSNYALKDTLLRSYAEQVMAHLDDDGILLWDEAHKENIYAGDPGSFGNSSTGKSPLSVMLSKQSLRYAWYLLLASALLYILFGGKRKQKVIPVIEPNTNTSLEFIRTISDLYRVSNTDHKPIAEEMKEQLYSFIRNRFGLKQLDNTDDFILLLSVRSKYPEEKTRQLIQTLNNIDDAYWGNEQSLSRFNTTLEEFYDHCKPISEN